jgi:phytoene dehydrogenase-like protein
MFNRIGIGLAAVGTAAAALLAKAGKNVLVVERHDRPGSYAHAFQRKQYHFDATTHFIGECQYNGFIDDLLRYLGVRERCFAVLLCQTLHVQTTTYSGEVEADQTSTRLLQVWKPLVLTLNATHLDHV